MRDDQPVSSRPTSAQYARSCCAGVILDAKGYVARFAVLIHRGPRGSARSHRRAARRGALIVEDDYDSDFRYAGRPLESLETEWHRFLESR